jgi:hypothetical protein
MGVVLMSKREPDRCTTAARWPPADGLGRCCDNDVSVAPAQAASEAAE